jgi:cytosine/adenosine deaminase-related metal-dependent hydrolase
MLPGPGLLDEITLLTGCGLSAMAALQAATQRAAAALKLPETGTLEPGKIADLVIVGADPLSNPEHLKRTWRVMKGGYVHDPAALLAPTIESYQAELRKAWVARIAAALGVLAVLGGLLAGYRWRRSRWPPSA